MKKHGGYHYILTALEVLLSKAAFLLVSIAAVLAGYLIFVGQKTPLKFIFGIPLILGGAGLTINLLWTIILVIFSPKYNRGVCKICNPS